MIPCSSEAREIFTGDERGDVTIGGGGGGGGGRRGGSDCDFDGDEDISPVDSIRDFLDASTAASLCSNEALDTFTVGVGEDGDVIVGGAGGGLGGGVLLLLFLFRELLAPPRLASSTLPMSDPL